MKIGVVGFSKRQFDQKTARALLKNEISGIMSKTDSSNIEVVSGLTNTGVPKIAYEIAVELGLTTVGISAKRALSVRSGIFPCDKQIIVGTNFGDESDTFIEYIDYLIRIGGGPQSRKEVTMFKDNKQLSYSELSNRLIEHEVEWYGPQKRYTT
ncbi:hypothetical protein [Zooshikella ganghwensis]|uniref:hypothetical protein n=1 Tax=Zooshikella ganghwensis TaxID=202772 RepID=UPI00040C44C4|nr:hypothetical protein [Zooshikella ganghwensis]